MSDLIRELISPEVYLPRGHCYLWKPKLVGVELAANALIALTCLTAAAALAAVLWRRRRTRAGTPPGAPYAALAVFLLTSGLTHLFDVWVIWRPLYWIDSLFRLLAVLSAVVTAVALVRGARRPS